ncbi:hypothetical protein [Streptomyces sp. NPDC048248]|uniref:hypothetical protein n=1 Tax=Streptomyces sp. NPDC048248 TaxID=3365523 RepID=UPI003720E934
MRGAWGPKRAQVGCAGRDTCGEVACEGRPQQTGNVTDVRTASLTDRGGTGLRVRAEPGEDGPLLELSAPHHTPADLDGPRHPYEVKRRGETHLGVNHRQMGVGGNDSWGAPPLEEYLLHADRTYRHAYRLSPA